MTSFTLIPAYGRDYNSKAKLLDDFNNGLDFKIANIDSPWCGAYISTRDIQKGDEIEFRYSKNRKVFIHHK